MSYFLLVLLCVDVVAMIVESVLAIKKRYCEKKGKIAVLPVTINTLITENTVTNAPSKKTLPEIIEN